ncbi:MAG: hypothetical protein H6607_04595 [Flavobacteriales bacterium]|nr:hypothetical protein [Flavobacteriales bacterium]
MRIISFFFGMVITVFCFAQQSKKTMYSLSMGYSRQTKLQTENYSINQLSVASDLDFSGFDKFQFSQKMQPVHAYFVSFGLRPRISKNVKSEFQLCLNVVSQFEKQSVFWGIKEENIESIKNPNNNQLKETSSYQSVWLTRQRDLVFFGTNASFKQILSQRFGVGAAVDLGIGLPTKNGFIITQNSGNVVRNYEGEKLISEQTTNTSEASYSWKNQPFYIAQQLSIEPFMEVKLSEYYPVFLRISGVAGKQLSLPNTQHYDFLAGKLSLTVSI